MKRILVAILLVGVALGAILRSASAQQLSKAEKRRLFVKGAKLWPIYCNQCHSARTPGEKSPYEWDQEIMHMRMLGNIPAEDARALVQYLKAR